MSVVHISLQMGMYYEYSYMYEYIPVPVIGTRTCVHVKHACMYPYTRTGTGRSSYERIFTC